MDRSAHTALRPEELDEENVVGVEVYGIDDKSIGTVSHLIGMGRSTQAVIDVGGFLGLGAKPVALAMVRLNFMRDENGMIHAITTMTKDELQGSRDHRD